MRPARALLGFAAGLLWAFSASAATVSVFTCPGASQVLLSDGAGNQYPACASAAGTWTNVELAEPFDPSALDSSEMAGAFGAGFVVVGVGLVIAGACRMVLRSLQLGSS